MMDRVLVIINEDVITQSEFDYRLDTVRGELQQAGQEVPANVEKQLLDAMISDKIQLQEAQKRGIRISDEELSQAIGRFAAAQNLSYEQIRGQIESQGQSFNQFTESVRDSLTLSRLTEFYAQTQVVVPEYEIEGFIAQNDLGEAATEYQIAHILIKNPDQNEQLANQVKAEIDAGLSFQQAVLKYSEATDAQEGGLIGWRTMAQLPEVFAEAIRPIQVGATTPVLKSANGLHILKLIDIKGERQEVLQAKVRHILIKASTPVGKAQAAKKLFDIKQRIENGEDFDALARIYSDDSVSAANGGDLGWVSPGDTVPQFEQTFQQLAIGVISQPVDTQYGVHILEVLDRRQKNITEQMIRNRADNILRRQRADREFQQWVRELREQAYIVFIDQESA